MREPRKIEEVREPVPHLKVKSQRFRIERLEERIAPSHPGLAPGKDCFYSIGRSHFCH